MKRLDEPPVDMNDIDIEDLPFSTGNKRGMTPQEVLRAYSTARAELFKLVPELKEDIIKQLKEENER